jgi:ATP-binding cassette subfamily F protein 3
VGYFSQDAAETIGGSLSILEYLEAEAPTHLIPRLRDMLGAFLFRGDDVYKALSVLSGGEKSRLALLRMLLKPLNLLILDEPTNHLDLHSKDILLNCLKAFRGTVIFVSHDRAFMEALSTKTLGLGAGRHCLYYGGYAYYLERTLDNAGMAEHGAPSSSSLNENTPAQPSMVGPSVTQPVIEQSSIIKPSPAQSESLPRTVLPNVVLIKAGTGPVLSASERREQEKQRQAVIRRLERQEAEIVKSLEDLSAEKKRLETDLARPENYSSGEKAKAIKLRLDENAAALEAKSHEWEAKAEELEAARSG